MIYFLRHGLDDERYVGGWSDLDLLPEGIDQVNNTLEKMHEMGIEINKVYSSSVKRANTTADLAIKSYKLESFEVNPEYNEQNKGLLNGMLKSETPEEFMKYRGVEVEIDTVFPEGESMVDMYNRIKDYLDEILKLEDNTLIVTHRGVINMIYYILNDIKLDMDKDKFDVDHASLHELDKENKTIRRII